MDLVFSQEELDFQDEIKVFLQSKYPLDIKQKQDKSASIKDREWGINKQRLIKNRSL